jgi:hypothetical protein
VTSAANANALAALLNDNKTMNISKDYVCLTMIIVVIDENKKIT